MPGVRDTVVQETDISVPLGTYFLKEFKIQALACPLNAEG